MRIFVDALDRRSDRSGIADLTYTPMLNLLLENGADPQMQDGAGGSALHVAAYAGQEAVIRGCFLDCGAEVDAKAAVHNHVR